MPDGREESQLARPPLLKSISINKRVAYFCQHLRFCRVSYAVGCAIVVFCVIYTSLEQAKLDWPVKVPQRTFLD